jgi:hypothetical protein
MLLFGYDILLITSKHARALQREKKKLAREKNNDGNSKYLFMFYILYSI